MKRFLSVLLVAMLIVTCLSTVAFAATVVKTGETKTFTVTVSGDEFTNYGIQLSADAGLKITNISGVAANVGTGKVGYAGMENVTSHSFQVTVQVTATEPGTYNVYASVLQADKQVTVTDENGNSVVKLVPASVSANGASFVIECNHDWSDWTVVKEATCTEDGLMERVCSLCGEKETKAIPAAHSWTTVWKYNSSKHWHECSVCGEKKDEAGHTMILIDAVPPTPEENGFYLYDCEVCDYRYSDSWEWNEEPKVGDIRPMIFLGIAGVVSMLAAVSYVFKRKSVI